MSLKFSKGAYKLKYPEKELSEPKLPNVNDDVYRLASLYFVWFIVNVNPVFKSFIESSTEYEGLNPIFLNIFEESTRYDLKSSVALCVA